MIRVSNLSRPFYNRYLVTRYYSLSSMMIPSPSLSLSQYSEYHTNEIIPNDTGLPYGMSMEELQSTSSTIHLTPNESHIVDLLLECVTQYRLNITLRFAGGWVRDKILGKDCDDIDVSIDKMTGITFATKFNTFLSDKGLHTSHIGVISARPDQSKHLETATITVLSQRLDFLNLRTEYYSETSRIPKSIAFGNPFDDARRRDITINALFYNIHTKLIEDFTGKGLYDLRNHFIRTPMPAKEIFLDDPLRVLRVIRFATRLDYDVDPEIKEAAQLDSVKKGLREKISRERIGTELKKMLTHSELSASRSIRMIHQFGLYTNVFLTTPNRWIPPVDSSFPRIICSKQASILSHVFDLLLSAVKLPNITDDGVTILPICRSMNSNQEDISEHMTTIQPITKPFSPSFLYLGWIVVNLLPYKRFMSYKHGLDRGKVVPVVDNICRHTLKMSNIHTEQVLEITQSVDEMIEFYTKSKYHDDILATTIPVSPLISCIRRIGPRWEYTWLMAQLLYTCQQLYPSLFSCEEYSYQPGFHDHDEPNMNEIKESHIFTSTLKRFALLRQAIYHYKLHLLWTTHPLLEGNEIIRLLNIKKPDQYIGRMISELVVWQLTKGDGLGKVDAEKAIQEIHRERGESIRLMKEYPPKEFI